MSGAKYRWFWVCSFVLILYLLASLHPAFHRPASADDQSDLEGLVKDYYAAYARKDLNGFMALWSKNSPEFASRRLRMQVTFDYHKTLEVKQIDIRKVVVDGEKASIRLTVEINAVDAKTDKPAKGFGKLHNMMHCVKEEGVWKVWRVYPAADDLARALAAAQTEEERAARLAAEKELVSADLASALIDQGDLLQERQNYPQALAVCRLAQSIAEQIGDKFWIAASLGAIGDTHRAQGKSIPAMEAYEKALKILSELGKEEMGGLERVRYTARMNLVLHGIADVQMMQGNYGAAIEALQRSLKEEEKAGAQVGFATTNALIATAYAMQGNYDLALFHLHKALNTEKLVNKADVFSTLRYEVFMRMKPGIFFQMGNFYTSQGEYAQAKKAYKEALKLYEALGDGGKGGIAKTQKSIGLMHQLAGNYEQALGAYQQALNKFEELLGNDGKKEVAETWHYVGIVYALQGKHAQASEAYQKSFQLYEDLKDPSMMVSVLTDHALVLNAQGKYEAALNVANRADALARQSNHPEILWLTRFSVGLTYQALSQSDRARQAYEEAITIIEKMRPQAAGGEMEMQHFFVRRVHPYHWMAELLISQNDVDNALAYADRVKGRVVVDVLHNGKINVSKSMTPEERAKERELIRTMTELSVKRSRLSLTSPEYANINADLQKTRQEYEAFRASLYTARPEVRTRRGEAPPLTLEEVRALLPDAKSALMEFMVTEFKTYLFVLTQDSATPKVYPVEITQRALAERVEQFRSRLAQKNPERSPNPAKDLVVLQDLARKMHDLLLQPAQGQLRGKTRLIIVPDGALWELPFQALRSKENRYLIEDRALSYAPSLTALREMVKMRGNRASNPTASAALLAFGNPFLGELAQGQSRRATMGERLEPLPYAEELVKELARLQGVARSKVYMGANAREGRFKVEAGKFRIIYLAAHAILNNASPLHSYIVLSQAEGNGQEDGFLEAWELMNLDLKADMVALVACQTARGKVRPGEGMIGMTWALFVAGCPTTVASQWEAREDSMKALMLEFHRQLKSQKSKAEALRQASLKLLRDGQYSHPHYWAPFIVVGDGG